MSIIAVYQSQQVEVLDVFESAGAKLASVKAINGTPFTGGDKWAVRTPYTVAPAGELSNVTTEPQTNDKPKTPSLLDLALQYADKAQWYAGESVWLWRSGKRGAFLKECGGFIHLFLVGRSESCVIFWFDPAPEVWRWMVSNNVKRNYQEWVTKVNGEARR